MLKTKAGLIPFLFGDDAWNDAVWPFAIDVPCVTVNSEEMPIVLIARSATRFFSNNSSWVREAR